jgi:sugar lactone lactonase YvrE
MTEVTDLATDRLELGEGSRWIGDRVVLVDIPAGRLLCAPAPGRAVATTAEPLHRIAELPEPLAAVAPIAGRPGAWLAAAGTGFAVLDQDQVHWIAAPPPVTHRPWRMNDGVAD